MHIKQLIVNGFRSFHNQSEIEPFSPGHNVIVGRNGSGKSNFFDAIQFVLMAPKFAHLRSEDRQHLLHEGAGAGVMAAYVEIIFDNSDGRFCVDSEEVILRRSVGHKKDELFLNRKRVQKAEVASLLESAGFSKSNPYYIVQQGKVSNICLMKDKDRLNLLKEVAGTTVYEERRAESLKIMQETVSKQEQIAEILMFIEERLNELEKEKEELKAYEVLDRNRKALEYNVYDKDLARHLEQLAQIEVTREEEHGRHQEVYGAFRDLQDQIQREEEQLGALRGDVDRLAVRRAKGAAELASLRGEQSALRISVAELSAEKEQSADKIQQIEAEMRELRARALVLEARLQEVGPRFDGLARAKAEAQTSLEASKARTEELYAKQGRGKQFSSAKQRDVFLREQIAAVDRQLGGDRAALKAFSADADADAARSAKESAQFQKASAENRRKVERLDALSGAMHERVQARNGLQERRKGVWREQEALAERSAEVRAEADKAKKSLNASLPKHLAQGLAAVARIAEEKQMAGYYGPVIDNIVLRNDAFRTCVEVAGGNQLFSVIVDTDATAAFFIKELERRKAGRITFLPLNRIRNEPVAYPSSNDVRPLMDVAMTFDPAVDAAIRQVFGRKLLARDMEVAAHFSKSSQLDAITKDGDLVNRRGGFEGGYYDDRESKISAVMKIRTATELLDELSAQERAAKATAEELENAINEALRDLQAAEREREELRRSCEQTSVELGHRKTQIDSMLQLQAAKRKKVDEVSRDVAAAEHQLRVYRAEVGTPLQSKLSDAEREELLALTESNNTIYETLQSIENELMEVGGKRDEIRADLSTNISKRVGDLEKEKERLALKSDATYLNEIQEETEQLRLVAESIARTEALLDELDASADQTKAETDVLERQVSEKKTRELEGMKEIDDLAQMQDKLLSKRSLLQESIHQKQKLIRELGTLPRQELEDFRKLSEKQLLRKLKDVNEELKKYASVNRKALDQFISFNEQRATLIDRNAELEKDSTSITQLLTSLDQQKEEAILRTYTEVSEHFSNVFSELVPDGQGRLIMRTSTDAEPNVEEVEAEAAGGAVSEVGSFQGVQVRVSFSGSGENYEMQQLSGGQKALVALALIFAIQRSDPAPFYLFDEIDQALDANYRAGVARLIKKQAESVDAPAQFITTTFRPELVSVADKCYGVSLQHKVSSVIPLDKSDAIKFVIDLLNEEEAVGKVSAVQSHTRFNRNKVAQEDLEDAASEHTGASGYQDIASNGDEDVDEGGEEGGEEEPDYEEEEVVVSKKSSKKSRRQ